jgi:phosphatidylserine/phosphatidylglycerophosphate/cardiolipin synthase-like enzyme
MNRHSEIITQDVTLHDVWEKVVPQNQLSMPINGGLFLSADGALKRALLDTIRSSKEMLLVCSFLINDRDIIDALFKAAERGVKVFLLTASEENLKSVSNEDYSRADEHIAFLKKAASKLHIRAGKVHAKFIVADPQGDIRGILSTSNLNKEPLERTGEAGETLSKGEAAELANIFIKIFWEYCTHELKADGKKLEPLKRKKTKINSTGMICTLTDTLGDDINTLKKDLLSAINEARQFIKLTSFSFNHEEIFELLRKKAGDGVSIEIIGRAGKLEASDIFKKNHSNVTYFINRDIHAKLLVTEKDALFMTANIDVNGLDKGFDIGVKLQATEAAVLFDYFKGNSQLKFHHNYSALSTVYLDTKCERSIYIKESIKINGGKLKHGLKPDMEKIKRENKLVRRIEVEWDELDPEPPKPQKPIAEQDAKNTAAPAGSKKGKKKRK